MSKSAAPAYLILNTGAAFSSLSRHITVTFAEPPEFEASGPSGGLATAFRAGPVQLRIAGRDLSDSNVITLDFSRLSNAHGIEISDLIGYPTLSHCALTLAYHDDLIGLDRSR